MKVQGKKYKHLVSDVDRHGNIRFYVRLPGRKKIRIRHWPGREESTERWRHHVSRCTSAEPVIALSKSEGRRRWGRRDDGRGWKRAQQLRPMREVCERARIIPEIGFHVLRHTHASILAMQAVPMAVIARQLGHSDTRMTERHYTHLAPNYVADTIRASSPRLTETQAQTVVPIARGRRNRRQARM